MRFHWTAYFGIVLSGLAGTGRLDPTFSVVVDGRVTALLQQPDGRILLGGAFTNINGVRSIGIARLNQDYTVDMSFQPLLNGDVLTALLDTNGQIVINGRFTQVNGISRSKWARLNPDGSLDPTFIVPQNHQLQGRPVLQSDGKIIFGVLERVRRLNQNGALDTNFVVTLNDFGFVADVTVQKDGKILIALGRQGDLTP